jgi:hypothetical protein
MAPRWSPKELRADPWVAEKIRKAVAAWEGKLRPEELAFMTEHLYETLANHPHAAKVLRTAHPRVGDESGEVAHVVDDEDTDVDSRASNGVNAANGPSRAKG